MPWIRQVSDEHACLLPELTETWMFFWSRDRAQAGDVWECDECDSEWEVFSNYASGLDWMLNIPTPKVGPKSSGRKGKR